MSCVDCHKLVRGKRAASTDGLRAPTLAAHLMLDLIPDRRQNTWSYHQASRSMIGREERLFIQR